MSSFSLLYFQGRVQGTRPPGYPWNEPTQSVSVGIVYLIHGVRESPVSV